MLKTPRVEAECFNIVELTTTGESMAVSHCVHCGAELFGRLQTCTKCGTPRIGRKELDGPLRMCDSCRQDVPMTASFCPFCGAALLHVYMTRHQWRSSTVDPQPRHAALIGLAVGVLVAGLASMLVVERGHKRANFLVGSWTCAGIAMDVGGKGKRVHKEVAPILNLYREGELLVQPKVRVQPDEQVAIRGHWKLKGKLLLFSWGRLEDNVVEELTASPMKSLLSKYEYRLNKKGDVMKLTPVHDAKLIGDEEKGRRIIIYWHRYITAD